MDKWIATFPGGVTVEAEEDGFIARGPEEAVAAISDVLRGYSLFGWPDALGGWSIDTTPGYDPEWMYLRLLAAGALRVDGPCPPCAEDDLPEDAVVG